MLRRFAEKNGDYLYFAFRVVIGLVFFLHGWMKVSAIMGGKMQLISLMGLAAVIETVGGLFLIIGFLVRPVALISAIEMVFAWFMAHAPQGWNPLANKGEPALLFFAAFLALVALGARKWAIDRR